MSQYDIVRYTSHDYNDAVKKCTKEAAKLNDEAYAGVKKCEWKDDVGSVILDNLAAAIKIAIHAADDCVKELKNANVNYDIDNMNTDYRTVLNASPLSL